MIEGAHCLSIFAVGDIHGYPEKLESLINRLTLSADDKLIFLGDYIDRGPDSRAVISLLLQIQDTYDSVFLCGNHEHMLRDYARGCMNYNSSIWLMNGGVETLVSYGLGRTEPGELILPDDHWDFISNLQYYHQEPALVFVHGGLTQGKRVEQNFWREILWPRSAFVLSRYKWPEELLSLGILHLMSRLWRITRSESTPDVEVMVH